MVDMFSVWWPWQNLLGMVTYIQQHLSKACISQGSQGNTAIINLDYTTNQASMKTLFAAKRTGIAQVRLKPHNSLICSRRYRTVRFMGSWQRTPMAVRLQNRLCHWTRIKVKYTTSIPLPLGRTSPINSHSSMKRMVSPISLVSHPQLWTLIHEHNKRSANKLHKKKNRTNYGWFSLTTKGIDKWNTVLGILKKASSRNILKRETRKNLQLEN